MAGPRRKWLIAAALLAVAAALAWVLMGGRGKMEVRLSFIGYTNYPMTFTNGAAPWQVTTGWMFRALVLATNSGPVSMELHPLARSRPLPPLLPVTSTGWPVGFAVPMKVDGPCVLKPGETTVVEVVPQHPGPWFTEAKAQRREFGDRLYAMAWAKGGAASRRVMAWLFSPPPEMWPKLGPITNPAPVWNQLGPALGLITNPPTAALLAPTNQQ